MWQEVQGSVQEAPGPARPDPGGVQRKIGLQEERVFSHQRIGPSAQAEDAGDAAVEEEEGSVGGGGSFGSYGLPLSIRERLYLPKEYLRVT